MTHAYASDLARMRSALESTTPARFFITGGPCSGKSNLLISLETGQGRQQLFVGSHAADVYDHLAGALRSPGRVLIDDLDRAAEWLSEKEEQALLDAIRRSPAHVVCTATQGAVMCGLAGDHIHLAPLDRGPLRTFIEGVLRKPLDPDTEAPLRALTGGRADRAVYAADRLGLYTEAKDWESVLLFMSDHCTPEDKGRLRALSNGQQGVWAALAEIARGRWAGAGEVAKRRRMTVNVASMHLKRLVDAGYVEVQKLSSKQHRYRIADPLSQAHYLMRRCTMINIPAVWQELLAREVERAG